MTKEQMIEIAKAGFPERVLQFIDFEHVDIMEVNNVYRLFDSDVEFILRFPKESVLIIHYEKDDEWIQFTGIDHKAFNHLAAIRKMEELGLI